ncbi:hypothetical protein [Marinomonas aquimarina]|uniref:hypothetical protein n=1 Tax=Marinomonas aquimarina TaxID=295068 RepID=UPI00083377B4|nr:hypothetical protein [Marinomonas aquimarina]
MTKGLTLLAASLIAAMPAFAGIESIQVTGEGPNRDAAIDAALISAVEQVVGVDIKSERSSVDVYQENETGFEYTEASTGGASYSSSGSTTYRVLTESCSGGLCKVRLQANVEYDDDKRRQQNLKGMNANRRTLAIESFSGNSHARALSKALEARFVQDRLFSVVADQSKPGVDYVLRGKVLEAKTSRQIIDTRKTLELTGETVGSKSTQYSSKVIVEYQMVDLINNQIKWSAKVPTTSSRDNLPLLIDISSRKIFDQLKDNIYPLILLNTSDGNLVLNSGGKTVQEGELFDIYAVGEEMFDPYTKESLGYTENKVGRVKVDRVQFKTAYVSVVSGSKEAMLDLPIARRFTPKAKVSPKRATKQASTAPIERTSGIIIGG